MRTTTSFLFFIGFYCLLGAIDIAHGQELPTAFKSYLAKDGLSSNTVHSIWKDSFGLLWLGTEDGLNRFDGTNFKVYRHNPQLEGGLRANDVSALYESTDGSLWIGTNGGALSFYDRVKDSVFSLELHSQRRQITAVTSIGGDANENLWIASYGGLIVIDPRTKQRSTAKEYQALMRFFDGKNALCIFRDKDQQMWVGTDEGLFLYDGQTAQTRAIKYSRDSKNTSNDKYITAITQDNLGKIWIGTFNGLHMLDPKLGTFKHFSRHAAMQAAISSDKVFTLACDDKNGLWIGTDEGLDIMNISTYALQTFRPDKRNLQSLSSRSIRSILIDKSGIYWVGTYQGGLNKYDKNLSQFNLKECNVFDPHGLRAQLVTSFASYGENVFIGTDGGGVQLYDRTSNLLTPVKIHVEKRSCTHDLSILAMEMGASRHLWIGTYMDGLFSYDPKTGASKQYKKGESKFDLNHEDVFCLKEDKRGNLWVGTNGGGVNVVHKDDGVIEKFVHTGKREDDPMQLASNYIRTIEEDINGAIWIGSFGSGISVFHPHNKQFTFYNKENSNLPSNYVLSIKQDEEGTIWVGTSGNGVAFLKKGAKQFVALSENEGLINGVVQKIVEDNTGNLWFSTNKGLSYYNKKTRQFKNYTHHAGLQSGAFVLGAGICLDDGEVFFGGQKGFNHFKPNQLKINKNIPSIIFTELKVDNKIAVPAEDGPIKVAMLLAKNIYLAYKQNFSIAFEAVNYTIPEENQYEYQLEGVDKDWIPSSREHIAYYTNLDPGEYVFRVRASNNDGIWNKEGKSIKIVVAPPFWQTIYAYIVYMLVIGGVLLFIRHQGIRKLKTRFALEQERLQAKQLLEQERKDAEHLHQLDRMKIKFLTNLSHEFRTPISLIMGPVDHLLEQTSNDGVASQLNLIKRNARRLLSLVNQLLDFRKMEERELKLHASDADLVSFMEEVSDSFNDMAIRKKIDYAFYCPYPSLAVSFDHDKMERILFNLLSNAFKFTSEGGAVSLKVEEIIDSVDDEMVYVKISVKDSGIGIPDEAQAKIFESFFQHDLGKQFLNQGTGIGLSIVRAFVQLHGGHIEVVSNPGKGSVFTFTLKLKRALSQQLNENKSRKLIADIQKEDPSGTTTNVQTQTQTSILIVEDDEDYRFYMKDNLKSSYQIVEAADGKEGWQRALFHHPDLIICDVQMPVMNGFALVHKLKSDKRTKHIPVILLTASHEEDGLLIGLESGAMDYMTKPFDFAVLQRKIANLLMLNQTFKDTYTKQLHMTIPEQPIVTEKEKFLKKVVSFIHDNLGNSQLSVESLSAYLSISRASLYNKLLEFTGMSPVEFIRSAKLERAYYLLEKSDMTIAEIAYETGFANPNYFTKVFKSKYKITPSEFIQSVSQQSELLAH